MADPEIPGLLKSLVLMCGVFTNKLAGMPPFEWNALVDPVAASVVYQAAPRVHRSVGLDVTLQVTLPAAEVRRLLEAPLLRPVLDFAEVWFEHAESITFHDPLAAVTLFDDAVCGFTRGTVEVELKSDRLAGRTYWTADPQGRHEAALDVNPKAFFQSYFSLFHKLPI